VITGVLGVTFLAIQGSEWVRLVAHGLRLSSGMYGGTFYTLIGLHGLHVTAGVLWLCGVVALAMRGRYNSRNAAGVELCAAYWYFVCAIWPVLFGLVYLM
jgi:heme/copper-type cytochrome/quinol oxidase subunit 3